MHNILIIGAGLSGLTAAYELSKNNIKSTILEARRRIGGRIDTLEGPLEMGATWFGSQHINVVSLLNKLEIHAFPQFTEGKIAYELNAQSPIQYFDYPQGQAASYRIENGTINLINALLKSSPEATLELDTTVQSITDVGEALDIQTTGGKQFFTTKAIITLPPQLAVINIQFEPPLPVHRSRLQAQTHTWMGESIKFGIQFEKPFWRSIGLSGMGFSQAGVIQEMHDHCDIGMQYFALKGFLNPELRKLPIAERKKTVIDTVAHLMGDEARHFKAYHDTLWAEEEHTSVSPNSYLAPHQNNGQPELAQPLMNGKLLIAGAETAHQYAGYMDGAISAGQRAARAIMKNI